MNISTGAAYAPRLHVLVVDDVPELRDLMTAFLTRDGHTVDTASDGLEGWVKFQAGQFDVVITDLTMPGMPGDQLAAAIKHTSPGTRVIMVTGSDPMRQGTPQRLHGIDVLLSKPCTWMALRNALS